MIGRRVGEESFLFSGFFSIGPSCELFPMQDLGLDVLSNLWQDSKC